ncbi:MAG TPA: hypothetical protein VK674_04335 [Candidatus Limnocylindria bacterium]|nr:hypothetical protein [Candidatus Limnocylindria bacterium]
MTESHKHLPFWTAQQSEPTSLDPALVSRRDLEELVATEDGQRLLVNGVRAAITSSVRAPGDLWPGPLKQSGLTCQTVALINGIRAWQAVESPDQVWNPTQRDVEAMRQEADKLATLGAETTSIVARVLEGQGLLHTHATGTGAGNPIQHAGVMKESGFVVVTNEETSHSYTITPNLPGFGGPYGAADFLRLDSYGPRQDPMTAAEFIDEYAAYPLRTIDVFSVVQADSVQ